jgi:hypothetical protein
LYSVSSIPKLKKKYSKTFSARKRRFLFIRDMKSQRVKKFFNRFSGLTFFKKNIFYGYKKYFLVNFKSLRFFKKFNNRLTKIFKFRPSVFSLLKSIDYSNFNLYSKKTVSKFVVKRSLVHSTSGIGINKFGCNRYTFFKKNVKPRV